MIRTTTIRFDLVLAVDSGRRNTVVGPVARLTWALVECGRRLVSISFGDEPNFAVPASVFSGSDSRPSGVQSEGKKAGAPPASTRFHWGNGFMARSGILRWNGEEANNNSRS